MIPDQQRAIDPFSTYKSSNVNRLTRMVTNGENLLCRDTHLFVTKDLSDDSILYVSEGSLIKDDVYIQCKNNSSPDDFFILDVKDPDNYTNLSLLTGTFPQYTYIALDYRYQENPSAPVAKLVILQNKSLLSNDRYFFLAMVEFLTPTIVGTISVSDTSVLPNVVRNVANFTDPYSNSDVLAYLQTNLVNTATVVWDFSGGTVKATCIFATSARNLFTSWNGAPIVVTHNSNKFPVIQVIDSATRKLVQAIITHTSLDEFTLTFDTDTTPNPYNIIVVY